MKTLRLVLGDQLTRDLASLADLDPANDIVLMLEVAEETTYVPHHKQKIALVLSAMRHFAEGLRAEGITVDYVTLDDPDNQGSFSAEITRAVARYLPDRIVLTEPGEWRVLQTMRSWERSFNIPVEIRDDDRFYANRARFARWAEGRKGFRMEFFYREMRRENGVLMEGDEPAGGQWNFDHDNRKSLPAGLKPPNRDRFAPDAITREVLTLVASRFAHHFGDLEPFGWAVTREDALGALEHFLDKALPSFGDYQDAMKVGEPFLFHSLISPYLNIGLLTAREVVQRAEQRWHKGGAPLNAVEGFIRQILGWREYVRGIYWTQMPAYADRNELDAQHDLPPWFWTGDTDMACLRDTITQTLEQGYAHHIQRLMVTGLYALLLGAQPQQVHAWYLAMYVDAVEWVELPNTLGMSQYADGGVMASKPYVATGKYIQRMGPHCKGCRYDPAERTGESACPFTTLYWDFLMRHEKRMAKNPRMALQVKNVARLTDGQKAAVTDRAAAIRRGEVGASAGLLA